MEKVLRVAATLLLLAASCTNATKPETDDGSGEGYISLNPTKFKVDPFWPKPLPNNWILGQVSGVALDADDHVWIIQRPGSVTKEEAGAIQNPPLGECCAPAPSVMEFDPEGNLIQAWGAQDSTQHWMQSEHGIFVDAEGNVWVGSNGVNDQVVLKLSKQGKVLLQIGTWGESKGSNNTELLGRPADIAVDIPSNEVYIADGYANRRVIVFDAKTGVYKRHWGAYGKPPNDLPLPPYDPTASPNTSFGNPVHAVVLSADGFVYVADRTNNRIQVFQRDGVFVKEGFVAKPTLSMGAAWDIELSRDASQTYLYLADGVNKKVWILSRSDLRVVGSLGHGGRQAGQFGWIHNIAMDSKGNLYTTEVETGKRIQKFLPASDQ